jgi:hypothetical protein
MQVPDVVNRVVALGFPIHFIVFLGVGKVVGSIGTAAPGFRSGRSERTRRSGPI